MNNKSSWSKIIGDWIDGDKPDEEEYYYVNKKTKTPLYWNGEKWCKPVVTKGAYTGVVQILEKQPKITCYAVAKY
jgi:hypothetical protein